MHVGARKRPPLSLNKDRISNGRQVLHFTTHPLELLEQAAGDHQLLADAGSARAAA
jgi:hypothetical protein